MILFMHLGKQTLYRYFHDCTVCQAAPSPTTRRSPWKPEQADPAKPRLQMHSEASPRQPQESDPHLCWLRAVGERCQAGPSHRISAPLPAIRTPLLPSPPALSLLSSCTQRFRLLPAAGAFCLAGGAAQTSGAQELQQHRADVPVSLGPSISLPAILCSHPPRVLARIGAGG